MKRKNATLGWKPEKGSLERKWENFQRLMGGTNRRMKGQRPDNIRSLFEILNPFQNRKIWTFYSKVPSPNFWAYHGRSWRLSNCHIQRQQKWIFLRCLIFKEFIFPKKRGLKNVPPLLLNQFVKINLLSQIIWFQVNTLFRNF